MCAGRPLGALRLHFFLLPIFGPLQGCCEVQFPWASKRQNLRAAKTRDFPQNFKRMRSKLEAHAVNMGKTPRSGKHASSSGPSSTAAAAGGYSHHQKASSSQKVSSTIASMLNELSTLVRQTQVGWALIGIVGLPLCLWYRVRERPANRLWQTLQRHTIE